MNICHLKNKSFLRTHFSNNATLKLLQSSILVSISGTFRIYLAALLLGTQVSWLTCLAGGLIIYSVYTLDRALDCKEDLVNRSELTGSCKDVGLIISAIFFMIGSYVFASEGILWLAFFPFITGYLYSKGLRVGRLNLRLKGGLGVKNIVVGITWGVCTACVAGHSSGLLPLAVVFLLYGVKTAINSVIDDFKDAKGDSLAGLNTLPVCCGELGTRKILLGLHISSHLILVIALYCGVIAFEPLIVLGSLICGLVCILKFTNEEKYKSKQYEITIFKDFESVLITALISIITIFIR